MKRNVLLLTVAMFVAVALQAQESGSDTTALPKYWKLSGSASINMSQSSYSNWAAGGQNSIAGVASGGLVLDYTKNKWSWNSSLDASYGLMVQKESGRSKTDDKLEVASKLGLEASKKWKYTFLAQFKTQFDKGYPSYPVQDEDKGNYSSKFMAPGYLTLSLGMDYNPNADLSIFMSPITMRATYVQDHRLAATGSYGVNPGKKSLVEYGGFLKAVYQKKLVEDRILLKSKLELFTNWAENPENITVDWEVNIDFKVTKWLSTKLYTQLLYDDKIKITDAKTGEVKGPRVQFKEVLGIGLSYIF